MRQILNQITSTILRFILPLTAFLVPLFFLPITSDFFNPNKQLLLNIIASLALIAWSVRLILYRQVRLTITPATLPAFILVGVYIISSIFQSSNLWYSFFGSTSTIISLFIIFLTTTSSLNQAKHLKSTLISLILSLALSSILIVLLFTEALSSFTTIPWLNNTLFNPVGGPLPFLTLAIPVLPAAILISLRYTKGLLKIILLLSACLIIAATVINISYLVTQPTSTRVLLPLGAGWAIAIENLKSLRSALLGSGPENFISTFSHFKPLSMNSSTYWNVNFSTSTNNFLTVLTTVGILGFVSYLLTLFRPLSVYLNHKTKRSELYLPLLLSYLLTILVQLIVPATIPLLALTFILLSLLTIELKQAGYTNDVVVSFFAAQVTKPQPENTQPQSVRANTEVMPWVVLLLVITMLGLHGYYRGRSYAAELAFYRSIQAAAADDGIATYNEQIAAFNLDPADPRYRIAASQTNLALANSIAAKGNLSDQDRANITQLIQQAIREAKAATVLDPQNPSVWANLANIYRQLINLAQGADQWTVAAYTQAIALDPLNPQLRLDLGGVYYSLKNYTDAIRLFQQAVEAKSDWPNGHYNLASAYRESGQFTQALQEMRIVVQLLDPNSADYQKAQDELTQLEAKVKELTPPAPTPSTSQTTPNQEGLQVPTPIPSPTITPIQLPDDSGLNIPPSTSEATESGTPQP